MTVARRILIHVALGAAFVIAVVAAATYAFVFQAAGQRVLEHLNTYVAERTLREEAGFQTVYSNLEVVRSQFLKRLSGPPIPDLDALWNERFELYPDGAWRNRERYYSPRVYSNLWLKKGVPITPELQNRFLRGMEICEEVQPGWVDTFTSVYFIFPGPATMGFDPRIPRWSWQTPGDYDLDAEEWVQAASVEKNPSGSFVWTGVFVDPPTQEPFVTVQLPVRQDGVQIAAVAHDMHINQLFNEITRSDFAGATHLIFRSDGRLIAHPALRDRILSTDGQVTCENSGDPALASLYRIAIARGERQFSGIEPVSKAYFSASRVPSADWYFVTTMPQAIVRQQAFRSAKWVWLSGLASLGLLFVLFAGILRRQVTRPLQALTRATKAMSAGRTEMPSLPTRGDELGELAESFREMVGEVAAREHDLKLLNIGLEQRVAERTLALDRALTRERELGEMRSRFVSLVSHEFRTPLGIIGSSAEILERYFARLQEAERREHLENITVSVERMGGMMEEILVLSRMDAGRIDFKPAPLALGDLCRRIVDELQSAHGYQAKLTIAREAELPAQADENLVRHVVCNLLTNAHKYSPAGGAVELALVREGAEAVFTVRDYGIGIAECDQASVFEAFHRGSNVGEIRGTGLGLVIVRRCCELHGGTIQLHSRLGEGSTFTVRLPVFP